MVDSGKVGAGGVMAGGVHDKKVNIYLTGTKATASNTAVKIGKNQYG
jgi:hypothetical protein